MISSRSAFQCLTLLFVGKYYEIFSIRKGITIAGLIGALGLFICGMADSYILYVAGTALMGIGFSLGSIIPVAILIERWFCSMRTFALSFCNALSGIPVVLLPMIITKITEKYGIGTAFYLTATILVVLSVAGCICIRNTPEEMGTESYKIEKKPDKERPVFSRMKRNSAAAEDNTGSEREKKYTLKGADYALILFAVFIVGILASPSYEHLPLLFQSEGYSPEEAAAAIAFCGVMSIFGKLVFGVVSELTDNLFSSTIFGLFSAVGIFMVSSAVGSPFLLYCGILMVGPSFAISAIGRTVWAADLTTHERFPEAVRRFQIAYSAGALSFSFIPGMIADRCGGAYAPAFKLFSALSIVMVVIVRHMYNRAKIVNKS